MIEVKNAGTFLLTVLCAIASGCASTRIKTTHDSSADFSKYRTCNFYEDAGPDGARYRSCFPQRMIAVISKEIDKRGHVKSDDPDLLINFNAILQEKTEVRTVPATRPVGGLHSYRE